MTFEIIPADVLVPLFYAEVSNRAAFSSSTSRPALIFGQKLASGTAAANVVVKVGSAAKAAALFGFGSQLHRAVWAYRKNDPFGELWCIALADPVAGVQASKALHITGPATADGTMHWMIAGQSLDIAVADDDTASEIGAAIQAALGVDESAAVALKSTFPVTASNASGTVTFTARHKGLIGNQIDIRLNHYGSAGGQELPAGVAVTELASARFTRLTGGTTAPDLDAAILAIANLRFGYTAHPYLDATSAADIKAEWSDSAAGRWGPMRQHYGITVSAYNDGTDADALAAVPLPNDPHAAAFGIVGCPTPPYELAAMYCGRAAASFRADPALGLQTLELVGAIAPAVDDQLAWSDRQVLAGLGWTLSMPGDTVRIEADLSTYTTNPYGAADASYRHIATSTTLDFILTAQKALVTSKFGRVKIVPDKTPVGPGSRCTTPSAIKAALVAQYKGWERKGLVTGSETFARLIVVEIDADNPSRVNVLFPPALAQTLRVFAALVEFRLAYTAEEMAA